MKAIVVHEHGGPEQLRVEDVPEPTVRADEVLVEVRAAALNHLDLWVRNGVPGHRFPLPIIPGCDVAGTVVAVGDVVRNVQPGDRVAVSPGLSCGTCRACLSGRDHHCRHYGILGETRDGGYAEYVAVPAANMIPLPEAIGYAEAACVSLTFITAWNMLIERARIRPGQTVLVQGASSGVGSAAIQIARLWGADVIAVSSGFHKLAHARDLGARWTIDRREEDVAEAVRRITDKRGVDVVVEHVGAATWAASMKCLARQGTVVTCGATTGPNADINLQHLFFKGLSILGSTMGSKGDLLEIWEHVAADRLEPIVDKTFPFFEAAEAQEYLEKGEQFGKVVLVR